MGRCGSPTPRSSGPGRCSSRARGRARTAPPRLNEGAASKRGNGRDHEQDQLRVPRRAGTDRARQGDLGRNPARRAGQRPGGRVQAPSAREGTVEIMSKTNFEFLDALGQIARDKGISVETLLDALANALVAAYKRRPDAAEEAVVTIDPDSGEIRVYGQELDEDGEVIREWDDTPDDFGRIAAQTAKQVILQRIREVERDMKYEEYAGREGDIVT